MCSSSSFDHAHEEMNSDRIKLFIFTKKETGYNDMTKDYEHLMKRAESILDEARFATEREDFSDMKFYYDLYDEIGELKLTREDTDLFRTRLDSILGDYLK